MLTICMVVFGIFRDIEIVLSRGELVFGVEEIVFSVLSSQVINSKQPNLGLTQESLRMVTARLLVVLSGSFTSQIEAGPTLT